MALTLIERSKHDRDRDSNRKTTLQPWGMRSLRMTIGPKSLSMMIRVSQEGLWPDKKGARIRNQMTKSRRILMLGSNTWRCARSLAVSFLTTYAHYMKGGYRRPLILGIKFVNSRIIWALGMITWWHLKCNSHRIAKQLKMRSSLRNNSSYWS
jgi:hypothetical protein